MLRRVVVLVGSLVLSVGTVAAAAGGKSPRASHPTVDEAIARIRRAVDPCGESTEVIAILDRFRTCAKGRLRVRTNATALRNLFDRPTSIDGDGLRTITWNPTLRSELERGCGDDPSRPVLRDPIASLLHEMVHAAQDCEGLNPAEHEFEAVRLENVYRRAAGLCQRTHYGEDPLPPDMRRTCAPGDCPCTAPVLPVLPAKTLETAADGDRLWSPDRAVGDSVPRTIDPAQTLGR